MPPEPVRNCRGEEIGVEDSYRAYCSDGVSGNTDERPRPIRPWACAPYHACAFGPVQAQAFNLDPCGDEARARPLDIDLGPINRQAGFGFQFGSHVYVNLTALRASAVAVSAEDRAQARRYA